MREKLEERMPITDMCHLEKTQNEEQEALECYKAIRHKPACVKSSPDSQHRAPTHILCKTWTGPPL